MNRKDLEDKAKEALKNKYVKFIAIGVGLVVTIYVGGQVCRVVAHSMRGVNDLKRAMNGN